MTVSPIFVVGMNGSGTTMMADSLGMHPDLYAFPSESKVLPYFISRVDRYGSMDELANRRRLARDIGGTKPFWHANGRRNLLVPDEMLERRNTAGAVISAIYEYLAARSGKLRWVDKSPSNTHCILMLFREFPDAKFIHIIRDGRDAAQSFHRRWRYSPQLTVYRWKKTVFEGMKQGAMLPAGHYLELRYESLTADPDREMKRVCDFLGIDYDSAVVQSTMRFMDPSNSDAVSGRIVKNSGKWQVYFSPLQIENIESIAGDALASLGYSVKNRGDRDLSRWEIVGARSADAWNYLLWFVRRFGMRDLPSFVRGVAATIRQWSATRH